MRNWPKPCASMPSAFAGARHSGLALKGKRVGFIISGGNVDLASYAGLLTSQLTG